MAAACTARIGTCHLSLRAGFIYKRRSPQSVVKVTTKVASMYIEHDVSEIHPEITICRLH